MRHNLKYIGFGSIYVLYLVTKSKFGVTITPSLSPRSGHAARRHLFHRSAASDLREIGNAHANLSDALGFDGKNSLKVTECVTQHRILSCVTFEFL